MHRLECSSPRRAGESIAHLLGVPVNQVIDRLRECSDINCERQSRMLCRPFEEVVAEHVLGVWPETVSSECEAVWFHGTRLAPGTDFREGLLPFKDCLPTLTTQIEALAVEVGMSAHEMNKGPVSLSHSAKLAMRDRSGPYASLLREAVVRPTGNHCDFLVNPEIVYDLAERIGGARANEILALYRARTRPSVVWFVGVVSQGHALMHALMYVRSAELADGDPLHWNTCFDGQGRPVPRADILKVEWLDG